MSAYRRRRTGLPVLGSAEHSVVYPAVEVDMRIQRAAEALHEMHRPHSPAHPAASECVLYLQTRNTVSLLECRTYLLLPAEN